MTDSSVAYLSKDDAARLCGVRPVTIQHDKRNGKYADTYYDAETGALMIATADLVRAGRLDPTKVTANVEASLQRDRLHDELAQLRHQLEMSELRCGALKDQLTAAADQIDYLRGALADAMAVTS